jgi:hypothetical protein
LESSEKTEKEMAQNKEIKKALHIQPIHSHTDVTKYHILQHFICKKKKKKKKVFDKEFMLRAADRQMACS